MSPKTEIYQQLNSLPCQEGVTLKGSVLQIKAQSWASKHNTQTIMLRMNFFFKKIGCEIRDAVYR